MKYTEAAGGAWMWAERAAVGIAAGAAFTAGGAILTGASKVAAPVITGFTKHGINQIINRGIGPAAVLEAVRNPTAVIQKIDALGRVSYQYIGKAATVVLNEGGKVITAWPR